MPISLAPRRVYGQINQSSPLGPRRPRRFRFRLKFKREWLKPLLLAGVIFLAVIFIAGTAVVAYISRNLPDPNRLTDRQVAQSTKIYDRTGEHLLYEVYQNQKRTLVGLDRVAPLAVKAVVAIEDKRFYEHKGVRVWSIGRAGFNNLIGRRAGSGGASTLTQQLIKKAIVGDERTLWRKIKEAILAIQLEKKYTKDEIMKMYLNEIPFGSTNYGIEAASQSYFRKSAADLTLPEAAALAAMLPRPSYYLNNLDALRGRRDVVLRLMAEQGFITEEEKTQAQNEALRLYRSAGIFDAPHFVLYVKQLLADKFGEKTVDTGGLKVLTTLDYDKQKIAETAVKELGDKFSKEAKADNAALVALDPKTAQVLALVGSRDFANEEIDGQFNVAILGKRQPGSSLKPFIYAAAWEKGYTPDTVLYDVSTNFDRRVGGNYTPKNYDNKEHGLVTMRQALQGSLNIPSVKTLYLVGLTEAIDFAKRFGYSTLNDSAGLSLVLGGSEVNLLEHTNGYATLADNGVYHEPASILKVTNNDGDVLFEWQPTDGMEAIKPELAALVSSVLIDDAARAFIFGRNSTLTLPGRPVAAKTGTTNNNKDAWTLGYTPSLAAGVWVGNTTPAPMKGGGNTLAGQIWNRFMRESLKGQVMESFPAPPLNDADKPVLRGAIGGIKVTVNRFNGKLSVSTTPPGALEERVYLPPHDILYYVKRDDPRGPAPENPADDPQYENWEAALQDWVNREAKKGNALALAEPPTEYDTGAAPELAPTIEILSPAPSSTVTSRQLEIRVKAGAPRGVTQVSFRLDGRRLGAAKEFPFSFSYYAKDFTRGPHTLQAIAEDDQGNAGIAESRFTLDAEMDAPTAEWIDASPLALTADNFPRAMYLQPFRWNDIKDIKIYLISSASKKWIYTFTHAEDKLDSGGKLIFTWKHSPGAGAYTLNAVLTDNGNKISEKNLTVEVK